MKPDDWTFEGRDSWPPQREGGDPGTRRERGRFSRGGKFLWVLLPLLLLFVAWPAVARFVTEWLWFDSLGFSAVFRTRILTKIALSAGSTILLFLFLVCHAL